MIFSWTLDLANEPKVKPWTATLPFCFSFTDCQVTPYRRYFTCTALDTHPRSSAYSHSQVMSALEPTASTQDTIQGGCHCGEIIYQAKGVNLSTLAQMQLVSK